MSGLRAYCILFIPYFCCYYYLCVYMHKWCVHVHMSMCICMHVPEEARGGCQDSSLFTVYLIFIFLRPGPL